MTEDGTGENRQLRGEPEADGPQIPSPSNSRSEPSGQVRARDAVVRRQRSPAASPGKERAATGGCPVRVGGAHSSRGHSERTHVSATEKRAARRGQAEAGAGGQAGRTHGALSPGDRGPTCATGVVRVNSGRPGRSACLFKIPWAALWEQTQGSGGGQRARHSGGRPFRPPQWTVCVFSPQEDRKDVTDTLSDLESLS